MVPIWDAGLVWVEEGFVTVGYAVIIAPIGGRLGLWGGHRLIMVPIWDAGLVWVEEGFVLSTNVGEESRNVRP
jgi:hypothetical protein